MSLEPMEDNESPINQNVHHFPVTSAIAGSNVTNYQQSTASAPTQGARPVEERNSSRAESNSRIFCPVVGCPESSTSSLRHFRDFKSIRNHLDKHCTGQLSGAIPVNFLYKNNFSQCKECDKIIHLKFKGICPKCKPKSQSRDQLNALRNRVSAPDNSQRTNQQHQHTEEQKPLPSLSDVQMQFVPTLKNIPKELRRLWAQCLTKAIAQTVWSNNETSWTELLMLAKCTLCRPPRGGKSHLSHKLAWTQDRLQRWLAGERAELWCDLPQYKVPRSKNLSVKAALNQRQDRCIKLTGEGGFSNA